MTEIESKWQEICQFYNNSELNERSIHSLAQSTGIKWYANRQLEAASEYTCKNWYKLNHLATFGPKKVEVLVSILEAAMHNVDPKDSAHTELDRIDANPLNAKTALSPEATDFGTPAWVNRNWSALRTSLEDSTLFAQQITNLGLKFGIHWGSKRPDTLADVFDYESVEHFIIETPSVGKTKIPVLAEIITKAWADVDTSAPSTVAQDPHDEAKQLLEDQSNQGKELSEKILFIIGKSNCNEIESEVLILLFGFQHDSTMTLEEVGKTKQQTRQNIDLIKKRGLKKLAANELTHTYLTLLLETEWLDILEKLSHTAKNSILPAKPSIKLLPGAQQFLITTLHGKLSEALKAHEPSGSVTRVDQGWWVGESLEEGHDEIGDKAKVLLQENGGLLPFGILKEKLSCSEGSLIKTLTAVGVHLLDGYAFFDKPTNMQSRCLLLLKTAATHQKFIWSATDLHQAANEIGSKRAGAMRLTSRDITAIRGAGMNPEGTLIAVNPVAVKAADLLDSIELPQNNTSRIQWPITHWDKSSKGSVPEYIERILKQEQFLSLKQLEAHYIKEDTYSSNSLIPNLYTRPQFVRYAPGYIGIAGLELEKPYIEALLNKPSLQKYVYAKKLGGLIELFPFWNPTMEYHWCLWAEKHASKSLFHSLLDICTPEEWEVNQQTINSWLAQKSRLADFKLPIPKAQMNTALTEFKYLYPLVHLAAERKELGIATIETCFTWNASQMPAAPNTLQLLGKLGVIESKPKMDEPWQIGPRCQEWFLTMSQLLFDHPEEIEAEWEKILVNYLDLNFVSKDHIQLKSKVLKNPTLTVDQLQKETPDNPWQI